MLKGQNSECPFQVISDFIVTISYTNMTNGCNAMDKGCATVPSTGMCGVQPGSY